MRRSGTALLGAIAVTIVLTACASPSPAATRAPTTAPTPVAEFGARPTTTLDAAHAKALQAVLDEQLGNGYPNALATIITPDGVWSGAAGTDGPKARKAAAGDVLPIASLTKTFTAALVLKLVEQHRMDLDARLSTYLSGAAAAESNGATVRQALAMRAGIPDTTDAARNAALADPHHLTSTAALVAAMPKPTAKPGANPDPSNPTYKLLALAAEKAGGGAWADLVRTDLVAPAQVSGTLLVQVPGTHTPGVWAVPPTDGPWGVGGTLPFLADTSFSHGATDMAADTRSMADWAWSLFQRRVVSAGSLALMADTDGTDTGSGLDPFFGGVPDGSLGHLGSKTGYSVVFVAVPASQIVVVVGVTADDAAVDSIAGELIQAVTAT